MDTPDLERADDIG